MRILSVRSSLNGILRAHKELPGVLRVWVIVPVTIALVIIGGLGLTIPPGPLCDEGMILFMEGGCDWGDSNVFFFSKLGLLLVMNVALIVAARSRIRNWRAFGLHFLVLGAVTALNYSDEYCRSYYSHPNGSIGQMTAESMAFAMLGIAIVTQMRIHPRLHLILALLSWNVIHIGTFYIGLRFFNHWTWVHTFWIIGVLASTALVIVVRRRGRGVMKPCAA